MAASYISVCTTRLLGSNFTLIANMVSEYVHSPLRMASRAFSA